MSQTSNIIIIGVVVLISILIVPAILGRETIFEKIINDGWNRLLKLRDMFLEDWGDGNASAKENFGMGVSLLYEDGTIEEYTPKNTGFGYTVIYEDRPIVHIRGYVWYKLDYTDQPTKVTGTFSIQRFIDGTEAYSVTDQVTGTITGIPESNVWTKTSTYAEIPASKIEEIDGGRQTTHTIEFKALVSVDVEFGAEKASVHLAGFSKGSVDVTVIQSAELDVEVRPTGYFS